MSKLTFLLGALLVVETLVWLYPRGRKVLASPGRLLGTEESAILRGARKAEALGCFSCHGAGGSGEVPNPLNEEDPTVPSFRGGEPKMYAKNDKELREYILYGHPKRLMKKGEEKRESFFPLVSVALADRLETHSEPPPTFSYTEEQASSEKKKAEGLIEMPAFRKVVSKKDVDDLVAFVKASATLIEPKGEKEKRGEEIVLNHSCFACHGPLGSGGIPNPRSFKGYIPSFIGDDFRDLVRNDKELKSWILEGTIPRFKRFPASFFSRRQIIQMPAFKKALSEKQVADTIAYLKWLRVRAKELSLN